jgi:hypothetical protein
MSKPKVQPTIWHHCGVIQKAPSMQGFAICTLRPGHFGAHYDAPMKASWDELRFVQMVNATVLSTGLRGE